MAPYVRTSGWAYRRRLLQCLAFSQIIRPRPLAWISRRQARRGQGLDEFFAGVGRNFGDRELIAAIREGCSRPLLRLLARRLEAVPRDFLARRAAWGSELASRLRGAVTVPGRVDVVHSYWVFPVLSEAPDDLVARLAAAGYDATRRATLAPIADGLPKLQAAFDRIVYLPFSPEHRRADRQRLVAVLGDSRTSAAGPR